VCDLAETCDGSGDGCPADTKSTAVCRSSAGDCDLAETCDGSNDACPTDVKSTAVCRPSAGICDVAETCNGVSDDCPNDSVAGAFVVCRSAAGDCDVAENCDGVSVACPADGFASSSVVCRSAAGACDVAESCTGSSANCPADGVADTSVVCRSQSGACDVAENCDGVAKTCPADGVASSGTVCRSAAGVCDVAESCDGVGNDCPADAKSTAVCRSAAGVCDLAETCDGSSDSCPTDVFKSSGVVCRSAAGDCDLAEACDGASAACPADAPAPNGTLCSDGNQCTNADMCQAGVCVGTPAATGCIDHFLCYKSKITGFAPIPDVHLVDRYEDIHVTVKKAKHECEPADKNGEGILDPTTHLASFLIKAIPGTPKHVKQTNISVTNQIGTLSVDTVKPDLLLVPSNQDLTSPPSPPVLSSINVGHFKCYKIKVTSGTPKFPKGVQVSVAGELTSPAKTFDLKKPRHLCLPVDKNGEGYPDPNAHLFCYLAKPALGQPKHVRRTGVQVANQFGAQVAATIKEDEFCVPSVVTP
jgi:hypothetical protein